MLNFSGWIKNLSASCNCEEIFTDADNREVNLSLETCVQREINIDVIN